MSVIFYKDVYFNEPIYNITVPYYIFRDKLNKEEAISKMVQIESIKNLSDYHVICKFFTGWKGMFAQYVEYCVEPNEQIPIIFSNYNKFYLYKLSDNVPSTAICKNSMLSSISTNRRIELLRKIQYLKGIHSSEYEQFNEGYLVLYSEPEYSGKIKIYKDVTTTYNKIDPAMDVYSYVNLTDKYIVLSEIMIENINIISNNNEETITNDIFINPKDNSHNITSLYDVHNMDIIREWDEESFFKRKGKFFQYLNAKRNEQMKQSDNDNVKVDTNPEQKKKQSTETLPWYSIITIIIFIILILLCIVYRESLRSWSNLANFDPRKFRDTLNPY